jgi:hypothetical protein
MDSNYHATNIHNKKNIIITKNKKMGALAIFLYLFSKFFVQLNSFHGIIS